MNTATHTTIKQAFKDRYGREPRLFQAPGRVNLIGEHTDYNEGFVMPAAINFHTWVAIAGRDDRTLNVFSDKYPEPVTFDLDRPAPPQHAWSDYVFGVAAKLEAGGFRLRGADLLIHGDVPVGAGLSSSASLEVATGLALLTASGHTVDRKRLAQLCQAAENDFVGMRCGIMDQFVSAHAEANRALLLDCRSLEYHLLPLIPDTRLVICNSMVHHSLAGSEYNTRRAQCEEGVKIVQSRYPQVRALRDVTIDMLQTVIEQLPEVVLRRCRHVVSENQRVEEAGNALRGQNAYHFGRLMWASHRSLKDDFEVSCKELDVLVEVAMATNGVYGARMTGGGFGGCTVNLVAASAVDAFREAVSSDYKEVTGKTPEIYVTNGVAGARQVV